MGAVCTSQANKGFHEERRHPDIMERSPKTSTDIAQTSLSHNAALEQIRNAPDESDDPNFVMINDITLSHCDYQIPFNPLAVLNHNHSNTSFSSMMSPNRVFSNDSMMDSDKFQESMFCYDTDEIYLPPQQIITIGDEIELIPKYNCLHAVVKFIGEVANIDGVFYGIELTKPKGSDDVFLFRKLCNGINGFNATQNSGCMDDILYFTEDVAHEALFVRKSQIARILRVNYAVPRIGIDSRVFLSKYKCMATVKYIGKPQLNDNQYIQLIYYGIQLDVYNDTISAHNCVLNGRSYFSGCKEGYGVFVDSNELRHCIVPSRYNLLLHGYLETKVVNITSGIVQLISCYHNKMEIRLTSVPLRIGDRIGCDNVICKKYEPFDIDNNICGPAITVRYTGCNTHNTEYVTVITGYYQFVKTCTIDSGDYNTPWVHKTEFQITQLKEGKRIFRVIDCDNEIPLMTDLKSVRSKFMRRHDIHAGDIDLCDHEQMLQHIAQLYGASSDEIKCEFEKYGIELYGLRY